MPALQAATALAWGDAANLQAAIALAWGDADGLQSRGSAYTAPGAGGGTVITPGSLAPLRDITAATRYLDTSALTVTDLRDGAVLPVTAVSLDLADGSDLWTLQASGNGALAAALRAGVQPATVQVSLGADTWRFVVEEISQPITFESIDCTFRGRSLAAAAGAPYQAVTSWIADAPTTPAQIAALANIFTGVAVDWGVADWLVPEGSWSTSADPLGVVRQMAAAVGAVVEAHRTDLKLLVRPRYATAPNTWGTQRPDVQIAWEAIESASQERNDQPEYNGVLVSGAQTGGLLQARLEGTSGSVQAPMVTDPLLTDTAAQIQRAESLLYGFGGRARETRTLQLHGGVVVRGALVRCVEPAETWCGVVRAVSVRATLAQARQTITMERPTSFAAGSVAAAELCIPDEFYDGGSTSGRTILALHGQGSDGSASFLDSSTVANVMVGYGGAVISTARRKFASSSIYLNGSGAYIKAATASNFDLSSGRLAFECQLLPESLPYPPTFGGRVIFCACENLTANFAFFRILLLYDGRLQAAIQSSTGGTGIALTSTATVSASEFSHIEFNQYDGAVQLFLNGVLVASATGWPAYPLGKTQHVALGVHGNGYTDADWPSFRGNLADARLTVRARRHGGSFAPPTGALRAEASDALVLNFSGVNGSTTFTDSSSNNTVCTGSGGAAISTAQSVSGGASLGLDGVDDHLVVTPGAHLQPQPTFTIACWVRRASAANPQYVYCFNALNNTSDRVYLVVAFDKLYLQVGTAELNGIGTMVVGQWQHVALVVLGTRADVWLDGNWLASFTCTTPVVSFDRYTIGGCVNTGVTNSRFHGNIDGFSYGNGGARYPSFKPPALTFCDHT